jgi:hypothetical protein
VRHRTGSFADGNEKNAARRLFQMLKEPANGRGRIRGGDGGLENTLGVGTQVFLRHLENGQLQNALYNFLDMICVHVNAVIGAGIERPPIVKQFAQPLTTRRQRARGVVTQASPDHIERTIEPNRYAVVRNQLPVTILNKRAPAQCDYARVAVFNLPHMPLQHLRFQIPKAGLTDFFEDLSNGFAGVGLDFEIDIDEGPADLVRERASDGGFAAGHEAD